MDISLLLTLVALQSAPITQKELLRNVLDGACSDPMYRTLREGMLSISTAPTGDLMRDGAVAGIVRSIGLTPDLRTWRSPDGAQHSLYGTERQNMLDPDRYNRTEGLWQVPMQMECAFKQLATANIQHSITIGTWSGWTDAFWASAFKSRARDPHAYTHLTLDIGDHVHPCVQRLMHITNTTLAVFQTANHEACASSKKRTRRDAYECSVASLTRVYGEVTTSPPVTLRGMYDLCFIDGDHTYLGVERDFLSLRSRCRRIMFHDVFDSHAPNVPRFWRALKAGVYSAGTTDVATYDECFYQPENGVKGKNGRGLMGLGIMTMHT